MMLYLLNFVRQEGKKQSVWLSSGKWQVGKTDKGCSSIAHNIVMKHHGEGAKALSGADWTDAVSDAYSDKVKFLFMQTTKKFLPVFVCSRARTSERRCRWLPRPR